MYHPFVDDQVSRIERQFRERQAAIARMARQLGAGRPGIWAQLHTRFQQVRARAAVLSNASCHAADSSASHSG
jgi:hypothetical protein